MPENPSDSLLAAGRLKAGAQRKTGAPKLRRAERSASNRRQLIQAAVRVIGERGYSGAAISRITERAGLSQGTFYLYFQSQQELFDIVLPELTVELLNHVASRVHGSTDFFEIERKGVEAFFEVVDLNPGLFRIINEAQVAAPAAFQAHLDELTNRYVSSLERARQSGCISEQINGAEFRQIAYMLIGARNYLYLAYERSRPRSKNLSNFVNTYLEFVRAALASGSNRKPARQGRDKVLQKR